MCFYAPERPKSLTLMSFFNLNCKLKQFTSKIAQWPSVNYFMGGWTISTTSRKNRLGFQNRNHLRPPKIRDGCHLTNKNNIPLVEGYFKRNVSRMQRAVSKRMTRNLYFFKIFDFLWKKIPLDLICSYFRKT